MNLRLSKLISYKYEYYSIVQVLFVEVGFPLEQIWDSVRGPLGLIQGPIWGSKDLFGDLLGCSLWGSKGSSWAIWGRVCLGFC